MTTYRRWLVLAVVLAADVLDLLDSTITNIAAPTITADLGGGPALVQWLGASYALALGVLLVVGGRLGDRFGRRRMFLTGLTGFTLASLACGLAVDPTSLVTARLVQGAFGALLIPQGFGLLGAVFPRDQIGKAFAAFGPTLGISAVGGPLLAAFLIQADLFGLGWRAMFLINIAIGGATLIAALRVLPLDTGDRDTVVDGIGAGLLGVAMLGMLYGLIDGSAHGWPAFSLVALVVGVLAFGGFCVRQRRAANPLIEPSLLRNRGFTAGLVLGLVFFAAVAGLMYVLSLYLQTGLGFTPVDAALGLAPVALGIVVASVAGMALLARLGRSLVVVGLVLTVAGIGWLLLLLAATATLTIPALIGPMLLVGIGMGGCFASIYDVAIGDIAPAEAGSASGSLTAVQQLASAGGAAAVTSIWFAQVANGQQGATTTSLLVVGAVTLLGLPLVRLLPRRAPAQEW
jgi:EmrB/QacA subfamily drug resistance transporter